VTAYAGVWVPAPVATDGDSHGNAGVMSDGVSCDNAGVPPKRKPHGRVPQGKVWNDTENPLKDDEGVLLCTQVHGSVLKVMVTLTLTMVFHQEGNHTVVFLRAWYGMALRTH
jgi:hypothetical protein